MNVRDSWDQVSGRMAMWMACELVRRGRTQASLPWFDAAVARCQGQDLTQALYRRARALVDEGRLLLAHTDLQRVLQETDDPAPAVRYLAYVEAQLGYTWSARHAVCDQTLRVQTGRFEEPADVAWDQSHPTHAEPEAWYYDPPTVRVDE
jgi:predicted Zn-dependent protease